MKAVPLEVSAKIVSLQDEVKQLQKENDKLKAKLAKEAAGDMLSGDQRSGWNPYSDKAAYGC